MPKTTEALLYIIFLGFCLSTIIGVGVWAYTSKPDDLSDIFPSDDEEDDASA